LALPELETKRLICVVGKGGVGRTTVATALAVELASRGRNVLLYQANAKEKLSALLGGPPVGPDLVQIRDRLWAVNPSPASALHEYGLMVLRYEAVYKMVFENRISRALLRAIPGLDDYAILGKLWYHTTEEEGARPRWDVAVFDAPATGHGVAMLRIPHSILEAVPEGPLTRDALKVGGLLEDPIRTATVIVTLAEEMPTNETLELAARLSRDVGMTPSALVVNQLYPDRFPAGSVPARVLERALAGQGPRQRAERAEDPVLGPVVARARMARERRALNDRYLARLAAELPLPTVHVPMLFVPTLGPAEIERIARSLGAAMPRSRLPGRRA
jgi:anion-transporting  ArsA/GET3 family ATPase